VQFTEYEDRQIDSKKQYAEVYQSKEKFAAIAEQPADDMQGVNTHNEQGINEHNHDSEHSEQGINTHSVPSINEHNHDGEHSEQGVNTHTEQGINEHKQGINEQVINEHKFFEHGINEQGINEQGINTHSAPGINEHSHDGEHSEQGINTHNEQGINEHKQGINEQVINEHRFNEQGINEHEQQGGYTVEDFIGLLDKVLGQAIEGGYRDVLCDGMALRHTLGEQEAASKVTGQLGQYCTEYLRRLLERMDGVQGGMRLDDRGDEYEDGSTDDEAKDRSGMTWSYGGEQYTDYRKYCRAMGMLGPDHYSAEYDDIDIEHYFGHAVCEYEV